MAFSLGTIFLQVAPSFRGVQEAAARESRQMAATMAKDVDRSFTAAENNAKVSGRRAGKNYGTAFEKEFRPLVDELNRLTEKVNPVNGKAVRQVRELRSTLDEMKRTDWDTVSGRGAFFSKFQDLRKGVRDLATTNREINADTRRNIGAVLQTVEAAQRRVNQWTAPTRLDREKEAAVRRAEAQRRADERTRFAAERLDRERDGRLQASAEARRRADERMHFAAERLDQERDKNLRGAGERRIRDLARAERMAYDEKAKREKAARDAELAHVRGLGAELQRQARRMRAQAIGRDVSPEQATRGGADLVRLQRQFSEAAAKVELDVDEPDLIQDVNEAVQKAVALNRDKVLKFNADVALQRVRARLKEAEALATGIKLDIEAGVDFDRTSAKARLTAEIRSLEATLPTLDVKARVDTMNTMTALAKLRTSLNQTQAVGAQSSRWMQALDAGSAANSVRLFNGALTAFLALGPLLIPALATLGAGLVGVGTAALVGVAGIGVMVAGLAGVFGAVSAMDKLEKAKRKPAAGADSTRARDSQQAVADARSVADAQRALARARESAADSIRSANRSVVNAEEGLAGAHENAADAARRARETVATAEKNLANAQVSAAKAQRAINDARAQAVRDLEDLNSALRNASLNERSAEFALQEAAVHLNVVLEDDQATDREKAKAQLAYEQAVAALEDQQRETRRLEVDTKKANDAGVEGSDRVVSAKDAAVTAAEREREAQDALGQAYVTAAELAEDAQKRVADALQNVRDANANLRDTRLSAARQIEDAERSLSRVHEDIALRAAVNAETAAKATKAWASETDALREAMDGLSPAGRRFATWLFSLKPLLDELRTTAQEGLLPGLQEGMGKLIDKYAPGFIKFVGAMAKVMGDLAVTAADMFSNPFWTDFFAQMADQAPGFLKLLGEISLNLLTLVAGVVKAFLPFTGDMLQWLADLTKAWGEWGTELDGSSGMKGFLEYVERSAPKIGELLGNIFEAVGNLLIGLAPYADELLDAFIKFTGWLADMEPEEIAGLAKNIFGVVLAVQLLAGGLAAIAGTAGLVQSLVTLGGAFKVFGGILAGAATNAGGLVTKLIGPGGLFGANVGRHAATSGLRGAIMGVGGAVSGTALLVAAGVAAIIAGIWLLWEHSDHFRELWQATFDRVGEAVTGAWEKVIKPVWASISGTLTSFRDNILVPLGTIFGAVFGMIGDTVTWLWDSILRPYLGFYMGIFEATWGVVQVFGDIVWSVLKGTVGRVITNVLVPAVQGLGDAWDALFKLVRPLLEGFGQFLEDDVAPVWNGFLEGLGTAWAGLLDLLRAPMRLFLDVVINEGLVGGFNWLAERLGFDKVKPVETPAGLYPGGKKPKPTFSGGGGTFAQGGILPGYTPGRDVFRFFNPQVGTLDLSGGEGILVPELTRAVGADRILAANKAARAGAPDAGLAALGGYKDGGVLGWFGDTVRKAARVAGRTAGWATNKIGDVAEFLKDPAGTLTGLVDSGMGKIGIKPSTFREAMSAATTAPIKAMAKLVGLGSDDPTFSGAGGTFSGAKNPGWQAMWSTVSSAFPSARLTSAYRPGAITAVGTPSYHGRGMAIDVSPSMDIFNWIKSNYPKSRELIYSPAGGRQLYNGKSFLYPEPTRGDHWDHVHWAAKGGGIVPTLYDNGGDVPPGLSVVANRTNKPEVTLTNKLVTELRTAAANQSRNSTIDMSGSRFGADPDEIIDRMETRRRDEMALRGLDDFGSVF